MRFLDILTHLDLVLFSILKCQGEPLDDCIYQGNYLIEYICIYSDLVYTVYLLDQFAYFSICPNYNLERKAVSLYLLWLFEGLAPR